MEITPAVAGLTVGAFVGVVGFIAVLLLVGRGSRRGTARRVHMPSDQVVFIRPYGTLQRDTPLPPAAFQVPPPRVAAEHHRDSPRSDPELFIECEVFFEDEEAPSAPVSFAAPVSVSAIVMVEESGVALAADKTAPHPLGIIPASSSAMLAAPRPASFADLEMDEGATEIGETYFDVPPQPRRRMDPPKIRAVAPAAPRFAVSTEYLSHPTPPASPAVPRHHP